eukprot:TRINITY_DN6024_c0_g2_i2.p1 TRINITY_DN6024_c0_g2~~TRINITY_DN6024_c0_g2_i2.p1  ORF type:complete len:319 (+),score=75.41 TRINITY_DN6024_c0_g2_i2:85-1041(+)
MNEGPPQMVIPLAPEAEKEVSEQHNVDFDLFETLNQPMFIRLVDKITFALGVINTGLTMFFIGGHQFIMPWFYTFKFPILVGGRLFMYQKESWGYFLLDFCYFGNLLLLVYLWIVPNEPRLFMVCFAIAHGPLLWAIIAFQNSLVFHSVDKITSVFIHLTPPLVCFCIRWYPSSRWTACVDSDCSVSMLYTAALPLAYFVGHQLLYYIVVNVILKNRIENDPKSLTTYKYLTRHKKGALWNMINVCGPSFRVIAFGMYYSAFAGITLLPTILFYMYFEANLAILAFFALISIWNGANFYIEVFSRNYEGVKGDKKEKA